MCLSPAEFNKIYTTMPLREEKAEITDSEFETKFRLYGLCIRSSLSVPRQRQHTVYQE